jgi:hypothetical protein
MNTLTIIKPELSLNSIDQWTGTVESLQKFWPLETSEDDTVRIYNDTSVKLDLSSLSYIFKFHGQDVPNEYRIISVEVDWNDDLSDKYQYNFLAGGDSASWLAELDDWLKEIGPHRYELPADETGARTIVVKIENSAGSVFGFYINLEVISQSLYDLHLEVDVKKAVFNESVASVVFKYDTTGDSIIENTSVPTIAILS